MIEVIINNTQVLFANIIFVLKTKSKDLSL